MILSLFGAEFGGGGMQHTSRGFEVPFFCNIRSSGLFRRGIKPLQLINKLFNKLRHNKLGKKQLADVFILIYYVDLWSVTGAYTGTELCPQCTLCHLYKLAQ